MPIVIQSSALPLPQLARILLQAGHVRGLVDDPVYGTIVAAVNQVGRLLGISTIAEEVDSEPVLNQLRSLGIGYAQGHALAIPEPFADSAGEVALPCFQRLM
jgi:EAL domain-containing protein (putative c-di-GMP-specific phosphodiesterase class I)